jgi:multicomponent Na+:H+ antiporter subunit F
MSDTFLTVMSLLLVIAAIFSGFFAIRGKKRWTRMLGMTMVSSKINMLIILFALQTGNSFYLDIALVYILLSYIGVLVLANYMAQKGNASD